MAVEVVIPMLGITIEKGRILKWLKSEGDHVEKGESLFEVETDKVNTEIESPATGILRKILIPEGVEVPVLTAVAVITEPGEELPAKYIEVIPSQEAEKQSTVGVETWVSETIGKQVGIQPSGKEVLAVPAARKLARERDIDLNRIIGSGPKGTILIKDVEAYLTSVASGRELPKVSTLARRAAEEFQVSLEGIMGTGTCGRIMKEDVLRRVKDIEAAQEKGDLFGKVIPMNNMRKVIARRLSESAITAPHIYFFTDINMEEILKLHKAIMEYFEKIYNVRPSINDFLIKAVALAIREYPLLNAMIRGDEIHIHREINIGLAVALDDGLIVPAIHTADKLGLGAIAQMRADLVERARKGKLTLDEIERGTFTISSLATFDITFFTAILNPPQSGILTVGKTQDLLHFEDGTVKEKKIAIFGLSVDHRIIDGAVAAAFLQNVKKILENPNFYFLNL